MARHRTTDATTNDELTAIEARRIELQQRAREHRDRVRERVSEPIDRYTKFMQAKAGAPDPEGEVREREDSAWAGDDLGQEREEILRREYDAALLANRAAQRDGKALQVEQRTPWPEWSEAKLQDAAREVAALRGAMDNAFGTLAGCAARLTYMQRYGLLQRADGEHIVWMNARPPWRHRYPDDVRPDLVECPWAVAERVGEETETSVRKAVQLPGKAAHAPAGIVERIAGLLAPVGADR
jgi:hypothetical protein